MSGKNQGILSWMISGNPVQDGNFILQDQVDLVTLT